MAGLIPKDFIQDLLARADVVEVVDSRVRLKKAGRNYQACCPFHNEKSPSFTVAPDKQFYHCFGCGAHGNALDFLMEYDGLDFPDAVEELASMLGVDVPREKGSAGSGPAVDKQQQADDYALLESCSKFFEQQLRSNEQKERVIGYLKGRGLSGETVKHFGIGYAPDAWDSILKQFGKSKPQQQQLLALKMITENDSGRRYDFFRDRIMFPIRDRRGRVVGFGGRVLDKGEPKYLNSPETRVFHKGRELYGFWEMKQANKNIESVVLVEGYMDVVALAQHGVTNAVASLGTAATSDHLQLLFRHTPLVICCFDGDRAGREAAWRALENALPLLRDGIDMRFLFLPDGEDPDSLVQRESKQGFEKQLKNARALTDYFFEHLTATMDISTDAGKSALVGKAKPLIAQVASDFYRETLMQRLANVLGRERSQVERLVPGKKVENSGGKREQRRMTPVLRAMGLLVQYPYLGQRVPVHEELVNLKAEGAKIFVALHKQCADKSVNTAQLLESWRDTKYADSLRRLASWEHEVLEENIEQEFSETYLFLIDSYLEQRLHELQSLGNEELDRGKVQELDQLVKLLKRR
ncbi:DNA primase [Aliidiomarina minuta]|uniref:DNA primase n=1 Tax=Aliidiomarina minuta TaxID=880057 RepID=A0A432W4D7_9GAMM|nr:DNA primase [Aliidiomarina minuta]RUO24329.1 DNA primase [Aliidiomarina minuta]